MWLVGLDRKAVIGDFAFYDRVRELSNDGQLVATIAIQGLEVIRQHDGRLAILVRGDVAVVDGHHLRRFDCAVVQIPVRWIARVIDDEVLIRGKDRVCTNLSSDPTNGGHL